MGVGELCGGGAVGLAGRGDCEGKRRGTSVGERSVKDGEGMTVGQLPIQYIVGMISVGVGMDGACACALGSVDRKLIVSTNSMIVCFLCIFLF